MGLKRLRGVISVLNALMAVVVCFTIVLEASHLPFQSGASGLNAALSGSGVPTEIASRSPAAHAAPSALFATLLLALGGAPPVNRPGGLAASAFVVLLVGGLYAVCVALGSRLLSAATVAEDESGLKPGGGGTNKEGANGAEKLPWWQKRLSPPVSALLIKDFHYLRRDSVLLSQLTMPMILYGVPFLLLLQGSNNALGPDGAYAFCAIMTAIIVFMQTSILSLSSIGLEGRAFWMLRVAPNRTATMLWAKFWLCLLFTAGCGTVLTLFAGIVFRASYQLLLIQEGLVIGCCVGLCGLGVGLSAIFPRFVYENPAHRVSVWALILGFFGSVGYCMATAILFGLAWFFTTRFEVVSRPWLLYAVSGLLYVVMTLYVTWLLVTVGARRIEGYAWEH